MTWNAVLDIWFGQISSASGLGSVCGGVRERGTSCLAPAQGWLSPVLQLLRVSVHLLLLAVQPWDADRRCAAARVSSSLPRLHLQPDWGSSTVQL